MEILGTNGFNMAVVDNGFGLLVYPDGSHNEKYRVPLDKWPNWWQALQVKSDFLELEKRIKIQSLKEVTPELFDKVVALVKKNPGNINRRSGERRR